MESELISLSLAVGYLAEDLPGESADGLFCRRMTLIGIEYWSEAMAREAARTVYQHGDGIADIDVGALEICKQAYFWPKDFAARAEARHRSAPAMAEVVGRRVDLLGTTLRFCWHMHDPDSAHIHGDMFDLPGARFVPASNSTRVLYAPVTSEAVEYARAWDFIATPAAKAVIRKAKAHPFHVVKLGPPGWVLVHGSVPQYRLPSGWERDGRNYRAPLNMDTVAHCRAHGLSIDPTVQGALAGDPGHDRRSHALHAASSCGRPESLPAEFAELLQARLRPDRHGSRTKQGELLEDQPLMSACDQGGETPPPSTNR